MSCSSIDLKAHMLGEAPTGGAEAAHIAACQDCREELERLRVTHAALLALPEEEVPQRIAFVSDKIFEPRWWQRIWRSGPVMGFASAALVAIAIFAHAYSRPATIVQAPMVNTAQIEQQIDREVAARVRVEVAKVAAESRTREAKAAQLLDAAEKRFELQRREDIAMMQQTARYYENKMGQLMVASNKNYGGAQ